MQLIDVGSGPPIVVIPGIQGRWEWMKRGIDALAARCRVITFSLADEPTAHARFDEQDGFRSYIEQVREALDTSGLAQAAICGVSYGGLIAAAFAAKYPDRTASLVFVSALPPSWRPDKRISLYARFPRLMTPFFCLASLQLCREIAAAEGSFWSGAAAAVVHGINVLSHPFEPRRMARRVHLLSSVRIDAGLSGVLVPTLVVTGESSLERVVPPQMTLKYRELLPQAQVATIARTGHLGLIKRPEEFADIVASFVTKHAGRTAERRIG